MNASQKSHSKAQKQDRKKYQSPRLLARQAQILACTRAMLAEVGYAGTTIRGLAERAGVAPGTLYNLYNSKDELVLKAVEDLLSDVARFAAEISQAGVPRIVALAEQSAQVIRDNPAYAEAVTRALLGSEQDDPLTQVLYGRSTSFYAAQLEIAQAKGQILDHADVAVMAVQLQAQSWGVVLAWIMGMFDIEELHRQYLRALLVILAHDAAPATRADLESRIGAL